MSPFQFRRYTPSDFEHCVRLMEANIPEFFGPEEAPHYRTFLQGVDDDYEVCLDGDRIVGAYGLPNDAPGAWQVRWILLAPALHGRGLGRTMMERMAGRIRAAGGGVVAIAASHKSAPFFGKFGATTVGRVENGWAPGMHRVDMEWRP